MRAGPLRRLRLALGDRRPFPPPATYDCASNSADALAPRRDPVFDAPMLIGVISDTHGLLRPEALDALAGVEHIIHAGDIGSPDIVPKLAEVAPVTAIRGNVDTQAWARVFPAGRWSRSPGGRSTSSTISATSTSIRLQPGSTWSSPATRTAEDRDETWRRLPQPRQRRSAPVQVADHACDR